VFIDDGERQDDANGPLTIVNTVDLSYFTTTGIQIVRGRDFRDADREGAVPVAIINETMARRYWPERDALGRRFRFEPDGVAREVIRIVKRLSTRRSEKRHSLAYSFRCVRTILRRWCYMSRRDRFRALAANGRTRSAQPRPPSSSG
jgi:MacB-like periplasmic core domain